MLQATEQEAIEKKLAEIRGLLNEYTSVAEELSRSHENLGTQKRLLHLKERVLALKHAHKIRENNEKQSTTEFLNHHVEAIRFANEYLMQLRHLDALNFEQAVLEELEQEELKTLFEELKRLLKELEQQKRELTQHTYHIKPGMYPHPPFPENKEN